MAADEIDLDLDAIELDGIGFDSGPNRLPAEPAPVEVEVLDDAGAADEAIEIDVDEMLEEKDALALMTHDAGDGVVLQFDAPLEVEMEVPPLEDAAPEAVKARAKDGFDTIRPGDLQVATPQVAEPGSAPAASATVDIDAMFDEILVDGSASAQPGGVTWGPVQSSAPASFGVPIAEEAPLLTMSAEEPAPVPSPEVAALRDPDALRAFHRMAGVATAPSRADKAAALRAALMGAPYDVAALPDARVIAIGVARLLADRMGSPEELLQVILAADDAAV